MSLWKQDAVCGCTLCNAVLYHIDLFIFFTHYTWPSLLHAAVVTAARASFVSLSMESNRKWRTKAHLDNMTDKVRQTGKQRGLQMAAERWIMKDIVSSGNCRSSSHTRSGLSLLPLIKLLPTDWEDLGLYGAERKALTRHARWNDS